jgi:hypothetical protein
MTNLLNLHLNAELDGGWWMTVWGCVAKRTGGAWISGWLPNCTQIGDFRENQC